MNKEKSENIWCALVAALLLSLPISLAAQLTEMDIDLKYGSLYYLTRENRHAIKNLKLRGEIGSDDLACINGMATFNALEHVDMSGVDYKLFDYRLPRNVFVADAQFNACSLRTVKLPPRVELIGKSAFLYMETLEEVALPQSLRVIENSAFLHCTSLKQVEMPSCDSIGEWAFCECYSLEHIVFPANLRSIDRWAFSLTPLKELVLPASLETIGEGAFSSCRGDVYSMNPTPPEITSKDGAFFVLDTMVLYVPVGAADKYRVAPGWDKFKHIVETDKFPNGIDAPKTLNPGARILVRDGAIAVEGLDEKDVTANVYDLQGRLVASAESRGGSLRLSVPPGIYVVQAGETQCKVVVK